MDNIWNIILRWKSENVELNGPASIESIAEAERTLNFTFPSDFKDLYLKADGFKNYDWQANMYSIWPIDRIITEYKENNIENFVGFCDYLLNCHQIGFRKDRLGIYKSYDEFNPIAQSFEEALLLINSDSNLIY